MFAYISGSPFVPQDIFGVSPQMYSLFFAVNGVGIVLFSQITGRLASRTGETKLLTTGLIIAAFGGTSLFAITWLGGGLSLIAPMLFLIVSAVGMVSATTTSLAMQKQATHTSGSASALLGLLPLLLGDRKSTCGPGRRNNCRTYGNGYRDCRIAGRKLVPVPCYAL